MTFVSYEGKLLILIFYNSNSNYHLLSSCVPGFVLGPLVLKHMDYFKQKAI